MDHAKVWVQQFHIRPIRNTSTHMFRAFAQMPEPIRCTIQASSDRW